MGWLVPATQDDIGKMQIGNEVVKTHLDEIFRQCRLHFGVADDFLAHNVNFSTARNFGGKGGELHLYSKDYRFLLKSVSKTDQQTLERISTEYSAHVRSNSSMLARILCVFHHKGLCWLAMNNWFYHSKLAGFETMETLDKDDFDTKSFDAVYDLKGCDDDKKLVSGGNKLKIRHNRWFTPPYRWPFFSEQAILERRVYKTGKNEAKVLQLDVSADQKLEIMQILERDVQFLQRHQLMDYSLLVAVEKGSVEEAPALITDKNKWLYLFRSGDNEAQYLYHLGIIDFLQVWNMKKRLARMIKFREPDKSTMPPKFYGDRFLTQMHKLFRDHKSNNSSINESA
mmetsp:Transcript_23422/g.35091  ORF Transcript_23422/g.35091 Transcript_23422/m.35091 type:complete len:341 (+) Transcript_23422:45-1067(+)